MKKYKTQWDLALLYKSPKDPQIEKDMASIEKACADFEKKYRNKDFTSTPEKLLRALQDSELLDKQTLGGKPWWYFALGSYMDSDNAFASAMSTKLEQRLSVSSNKVTFFALKVAKIPKSQQKKLLTYPSLQPFAYMLNRLFEEAKYNLSEKEENLANLLSQSGYSMWVSGKEKELFKKTVSHKGKQISVSEAREIISELPKKERRELHKKMYTVYQELGTFAEAEINAIVNYKKVLDEARGYEKPYSSTLIGNENDEESIEALASIVTKNFSISNRFYKLHAKLLGDKKITVADVNSKIGQIKQKFSFEKTVNLIQEGFSKIGPDYVKYFEQFLEKGQIDVYPRKGKWSGGFCWKIGESPTFILLNHTDSIRSVETLAHEMGHGFHNEFARKQPLRYQGQPASTAEVASTFFEQVINEELEQKISEKEKIILLHNNISRDIQTIFLQITCFNFEIELHNRIRKEGQLSKEEISKLLVKHLSACRGPAVETTELDGYLFVAWSHLRMFFYTYTYAFGHLISKAMYEKWKQDPSFESKVREFLSAGSSMSPKDLFKKMGIDISNPSFFESGLKAIDADISRLEKLAKKAKMI
jgi:oligoendopeptidase F